MPTPHTDHEYSFYVQNGPGLNEIITWTGGNGVTIGTHDDDWCHITFTSAGTRTITARITNTCNSHWHEDSYILTVYL